MVADAAMLTAMLHLHVGMGRTGSSSIQHFFRDSGEALAAIARYPDFGAFAGGGQADRASGNVTGLAAALSRHSRGAAVERFCLAVLKELDPGLPVVASSEFLFSTAPEGLADLAAGLASHRIPVRVHIYVRDMLDWHVSMYRQRVKSKGWTEPLESLLLDIYNPGNVISKLRHLRELFGERLSVHYFSRSSLHRGDVRCDFLHHIGCADADMPEMQAEVNGSASDFEIEVMRRMNLIGGAGVWDGKSNRRLLRLLARVSDRLPAVPPLLSEETAEQFRSMVADESALIREEFLPGSNFGLSEYRRRPAPPPSADMSLEVLSLVLDSMKLAKAETLPAILVHKGRVPATHEAAVDSEDLEP